MKIKGEKYDTMYRAVRDVVNHFSIATVGQGFSVDTLPSIWNIWNYAHFDMQNNDSHPAFLQGRKRIVAYRPEFDVYSDNCNDDHIFTVLKRIFRELGLE